MRPPCRSNWTPSSTSISRRVGRSTTAMDGSRPGASRNIPTAGARVIRVDHARWGQTPEDLHHLALNAPHARTRERALALFDITQHSCATQVAGCTGRRAHTVMEWVHAYNQGGPDAVTFCRLA